MSHSACNDPRCAEMVEGRVATCPKCGGPMRSIGESPLLGIVMVLLGLFLIGLMGSITWAMLPTLLRPGQEVDGGSFTGTPEQANMVLGLFALVIVFGITALLNGIYMIVTRRAAELGVHHCHFGARRAYRALRLRLHGHRGLESSRLPPG